MARAGFRAAPSAGLFRFRACRPPAWWALPSGTSPGVFGANVSSSGPSAGGNGPGVYGAANGSQPVLQGVDARNSGVLGTSIAGPGVQGLNLASGPGVLGTSHDGPGLRGESGGAPAGGPPVPDVPPAGVVGLAVEGPAPGVFGANASGMGPGVYGAANGSQPALQGIDGGNSGVLGTSAAGSGVLGASIGGAGLQGTSLGGPAGVRGEHKGNGPGVLGTNFNGGVAPMSLPTVGSSGVVGASGSGPGVLGITSSGDAAVAAVMGQNTGAGTAIKESAAMASL